MNWLQSMIATLRGTPLGEWHIHTPRPREAVGNKIPRGIKLSTPVQVRYRNGVESNEASAGSFFWFEFKGPKDLEIIAWRELPF